MFCVFVAVAVCVSQKLCTYSTHARSPRAWLAAGERCWCISEEEKIPLGMGVKMDDYGLRAVTAAAAALLCAVLLRYFY